jgi:hypothetical protein
MDTILKQKEPFANIGKLKSHDLERISNPRGHESDTNVLVEEYINVVFGCNELGMKLGNWN